MFDDLLFPIEEKDAYRKAGGEDWVRLLPAAGMHAIYAPKYTLEALALAIVNHEMVHLSGPTGSAKSALIEALSDNPENFKWLCSHLGLPHRPLEIRPIEMAIFDAPGELFQRRALKEGNTFDEESVLVMGLRDLAKSETAYPVIWLREIGRVHSASIQGGLLDLMTKSAIRLPSGEIINPANIGWVADSNYQAEGNAKHTLVAFDDALKRRFSVNITMSHPPKEQERAILIALAKAHLSLPITDALLAAVDTLIRVGDAIRKKRNEGRLLSVAPPTLYAYLTALKLSASLEAMPLGKLIGLTLLGNVMTDETEEAAAIVDEVLSQTSTGENDEPMPL